MKLTKTRMLPIGGVAPTIDSTCIPNGGDTVAFASKLASPWADSSPLLLPDPPAWVDVAAVVVGVVPGTEFFPSSMQCDRRWHHIRDLGVAPSPRREGGNSRSRT